MINSIDLAINRAIGRRLVDVAFRMPTFVGLLFGMDTFYNRPVDKLSYDTMGLEGGKMRFMYETGLPSWGPANIQTEDPEATRTRLRKSHQVKQGTLTPTAKEVAEPVEKWDINRLAKDPVLGPNYISRVSDAVVKGYMLEIQKDLFPVANVVGGSTGGVAPGNKGNLPAISYFLQTGFSGNDPTGSGTYNLFPDLDLNAVGNTPLKAKNWGTATAGVTLSLRGLEENLFSLIRSDGGLPDVVLCHRQAYSWLKSQATPSLRQEMNDVKGNKVIIGYQYFCHEGVTFCYEPRLDLQVVKELLVLDSSTWRFALDISGKGSQATVKNSLNVIDVVPGYPSLNLIQGYVEAAVVCENPAFNGRAYNLTVPA